MTHAASKLTASALLAGFAASSFAYGPTSVLYAVNFYEYGTIDGLDRFQGATVLSSPTGSGNDFGIAVSGDVRTMGYFGGGSGYRFDLNGNPLPGGPYTNTYAADYIVDGTTDGVHNYGVGYYSGNVVQFDRNWMNPVPLFTETLFGAYHAGITMNASDGSFWFSQYGGGDLVAHYTHTGTLISSFHSGIVYSQGLALDPVDGTLWLNDNLIAGRLDQFDQAGNPLQQDTYGITTSGLYGMEFNTNVVPEPASMAALALGAALLRRRRKA